MKYFFPVVPALFLIGFGCIRVLLLLGWASIQDPRLERGDYLLAVLGSLFGAKTIWSSLISLGMSVLGLGWILREFFLRDADLHKRREFRRTYWLTLAIGTVALLGLLVAVNYFSLQAGHVSMLSVGLRR